MLIRTHLQSSLKALLIGLALLGYACYASAGSKLGAPAMDPATHAQRLQEIEQFKSQAKLAPAQWQQKLRSSFNQGEHQAAQLQNVSCSASECQIQLKLLTANAQALSKELLQIQQWLADASECGFEINMTSLTDKTLHAHIRCDS